MGNAPLPTYVSLREAVIFPACPLEQNSTLVAWTLSRVPTITGDALDRLVLAMALLLGFVLLSGSWLGWTLTRWSRGVHYLAGVLEQSRTQFDSSAPELAELSGLADLDRVTVALNDYSQRLAAQRESARLSAELAQAEKLAALGELSAGLAHEDSQPAGDHSDEGRKRAACPAGEPRSASRKRPAGGNRTNGKDQSARFQPAGIDATVSR